MNQVDKKPLTLLQRLRQVITTLQSYDEDVITDKNQIPELDELEKITDNEDVKKEIRKLRKTEAELRVKVVDYKKKLQSQVSGSSGRKKGIKYKKAEQTDKEIGE